MGDSIRGFSGGDVTVRPVVTDPDVGIPALVRRLTADSKRLMSDEVRLAKLETKDSLARATKGTLWLGLAFGAAVVMLVALTILFVTLIGRLDRGHMWVGAIITGVLEIGLGAWLVKRGLATFTEPSYTLAETRGALRDTVHWTRSAQR